MLYCLIILTFSCLYLGTKEKNPSLYYCNVTLRKLFYCLNNGFVHDVIVTFSLLQTNFWNDLQEQYISMLT